MKKLFSALQPSGELTLGNFIGSIRQFSTLEKEYDSIIAVADMHSITVPQDPKALHERNKKLIAYYIASGLKESTFVIQSEVRLHAEFAWIFECITNMGELSRMTQFKAKTLGKTDKAIGCGLFTYPLLMAADILIYDTDVVPTGADQKQHIELARDIAERFNSRFGKTFVVPEAIIPKVGAKIKDLQDPTKKMSKSAQNTKGVIFLSDDEKIIRKKVASSVTDTDNYVDFDEEKKPGISNLLSIYSAMNNISIEETLKIFKGLTKYGELKNAVADSIVNTLIPLQKRCKDVLKSGEADKLLDMGRDKCREIANKKYDETCKKVGFSR